MAVWNPQANEVFIQAIELSSLDERRTLLDRLCGSDAALREHVEKLLEAHDLASGFLQPPASKGQATEVQGSPISDAIGSQIGPYKLLQVIGEGGMGTVYMAEQTAPVKRMVALKVIKPGMDSAQVIARFEAERQALALMDHPNIAKVLDAGTVGQASSLSSDPQQAGSLLHGGRPYFVMELVKGVPITRYCDEHQLTPRQRMELFVPVCQALQHAHQKGIIHRDVKPSNVLIASYDGRPVPKVIDFGVAKAMGQQLTERTMFTGFGGIVGTLEYMSPEQAEFNAMDVDTRSDIYSLGVLLYELLTGSTPLTRQQLKNAAITELLRRIREDEPARPSTRLSESRDSLASLSAQRKLDPAALTKEISGELDWIVMKALEKDRARRYETAAGLARDLDRYLRDEQVEACPPTLGYRLHKFARRHHRSMTTAVCFVLLFLIAFAAVTWQAFRASRAEQRAVIEAQMAHQAREAEARGRATAQALAISEAKAAQSAEAALVDADEQRKRALEEKRRAEAAREQATDSLARSQLDQAHAVRLAGLPGRRFAALNLLQQAEALRGRERHAADAADGRSTVLPTQAELRSEAVAALMLHDGRIARQWSGFTHSVSPDGRFAASLALGPDPTPGLRVIDLQTGEVARRGTGEQAESMMGLMLALGPRAEQIAVAAMDRPQIAVWDLKETRLIRTLTIPGPAGPGSPVRQMAFSPDGNYVAGVVTGKSAEVVVMLWNEDGEAQTLATVRGVALPTVAFSPDSQYVAFAATDKRVTIWNVAEERAQHQIELPLATEGALGFDPGGQQLAIHGFDRAAKSSQLLLWDIAQNREAARFELGEFIATTPIRFAPDGRRVAIAGSNRMIAVLDLPAPQQPAAPLIRLNHGAMPQMLAWSDSGNLLSGGLDGLKQWEIVAPTAVASLRLATDKASAGISRLAFGPKGKTLVAEAWPGPEVLLFERATGRSLQSWKASIEVGHVGLLFSPDGKQVFRYGQSGLRAWDVSTEESQRPRAEQPPLQVVSSLGFRRDGSQVVADSPLSGQCRIVDLATGKVIWQPKQRKVGTMALVSPDAGFAVSYQAFAVGNAERPIQVWSLPQDQERFAIPSPKGSSFQTMVHISPDSRWITVIHYGGDVKSGQTEVMAGPATIAFGQGFNAMFQADQPWIGEVWDAESGTRHCQIRGPINIENQAFSPDGRYLAVGMRGGIIRVWDIPAGKELFDWERPDVAETSTAPRQLAFADPHTLAVPDLASPTLHMLDLQTLHQKLAEFSLGW